MERTLQLTDNYISKAYLNNDLIKNFIDGYMVASENREGAFVKKPRNTILGIVRTSNQENPAFSTETRQIANNLT